MREVPNAVVTGIVLLHTIAVLGWAGSLVAWGYSNLGQLSHIPAGNDFVAASAGHGHNLTIVTSASGVPGFGPGSADFAGLIVKA